jgi:UDP-glucose 4-epimerase
MKTSYKGGYPAVSTLRAKRILVTGATGHIGSHLVAKLTSEGARVVAVARHQDKLNELKKANLTADIEVVKCDIGESQEVLRVKEHVGDIDFLVHLASCLPKALSIQEMCCGARSDIVGTCNILSYLGVGARKICFSSSGEVYGLPRYVPIDESHPTEPSNYFGVSKLASEAYMRVFSKTNCPVVTLRFSHVYGPGEYTYRLIPKFITAALNGSPPIIYGHGLHQRDYVYMEDAVEAILLGLKHEEASGYSVYNISSGQGHKISELAETIVGLCGGTQPPIYDPEKTARVGYVSDISAARRDLRYSPKFSLEEGLKREIAYFKSKNESIA